MKFRIIVLGFDNLCLQAGIKPSSKEILNNPNSRRRQLILPQTVLSLNYTNVKIPYLYHLEKWFATYFEPALTVYFQCHVFFLSACVRA